MLGPILQLSMSSKALGERVGAPLTTEIVVYKEVT